MPDETNGTAGSLGGSSESEYQAFRNSYNQKSGFMQRMRGGFGLGNLGKFNEAIDKLVSPSGGLARLQAAVDRLASSMEKAASGGGGGGGGVLAGAGAPSGGTNPHGGFKTEAAIAAGSYGLYKLGDMYSSRIDRALQMTPAMTALQPIGNLSYSNVGNIMANRTLTYGATGGMDALAGAAAAQGITGMPLYAKSNADVMRNFTELTLTNPGMSMSQAAALYTSLRQPSTTWKIRGLLGQQYQYAGAGGSSPDFVSTSTALVQRMMTLATPAQRTNPEFIARAFAQGQFGRLGQTLNDITGNPQASQAIVSAAVAQLNYTQNGGKGKIFSDVNLDDKNGWRLYEKEAKMAGYSNNVIGRMRDISSLDTKNSMLFNSSQEVNIARTLAVQLDIRDWTEKIARKIGAAGPVITTASGALQSTLGNPLVDFLLGQAIGKQGGMSGVLSKFGIGGGSTAAAEAGGGAGMLGTLGAGALGALGAGVTGYAAGHVIQSKVHGAGGKALGTLGGAAAGAATGALIGSVVPGIGTGVGAIAGGVIGGVAGYFGDAPIGDAVADHNATGRADSVSGLNPQFRSALDRMFAANPRLVLNSGYRSNALQAQLYQQALAKYGSAAEARKHVAPPGGSMHGKGLAADIGPPSEYGWLRANAGKFGLVNYAPEPWHWELAGASKAGNRTNYGVGPTGEATGGMNGGIVSGGHAVTMSAGSSGAANSGYGSSQLDIHQMLAGAATEQGTLKYAGGGFSFASSASSSTATGGGGGGGGGGTTGAPFKLPTGGDRRVPGHSITQWARDLLSRMGIRPNAMNMQALITWANHESGGFNPSHSGGLFNPLNTTESHYGYWRNGGAQGNIKDFSSYAQGLNNQAWNLTHTKGAGYEAIVSALRGNNLQAVYSAVNNSAFGTHGLGDAPAGRGGGGSVVVASRPVTVQASFHITAQGSSTAEMERMARYFHRRIQELAAEEQARER